MFVLIGVFFAASPAFPEDLFRKDGAQALTIVLDPGHGGFDTGAVGPTGLEEKSVNLSIALALADELRSSPGTAVLLTRTGDVYVPLEDRTALANRNGADLFISIHSNATLSKGVNGVETFFLNVDATDEEAMRLAAFENRSLISDGPEDYSGEQVDLRGILWDLTKTAAHHESSRFAEVVQASLAKMTGKENRGVKQAPFIVLSGAAMPAVLVEVGFISNPAEEKRLKSKKEHGRIAKAILEGIRDFIRTKSGGRDYVGINSGSKKN